MTREEFYNQMYDKYGTGLMRDVFRRFVEIEAYEELTALSKVLEEHEVLPCPPPTSEPIGQIPLIDQFLMDLATTEFE